MTAVPGRIVWFTGLSGAGKTTLCNELASNLRHGGVPVHILDGDEVRRSLNADLGFTPEDRLENVRRLAHVARMLSGHGICVLVAVISPTEAARRLVRSLLPDLAEIFVDAPLSVCETRDPKGLYKKARAGLLRGFTGVDAPFEVPAHPDVICHTDTESVRTSVEKVLRYLSAEVGLVDALEDFRPSHHGREPSQETRAGHSAKNDLSSLA